MTPAARIRLPLKLWRLEAMHHTAQKLARIQPPEADPYISRIGAHAEIVERSDPVVYSPSVASSPLPAEQVAHYDRHGFIELEHVFSGGELALLQHELQRLRAQLADVDAQTLIREPGSNELRSIFRIHEQSPLIARLARDARLVSIARYLLGDEVYIHQSRLNYKPGFFGKEFYWHSDFETWHIEDGMPRMRALSMSIALTENTPFNGPLMVIPGSHRKYIRCVGETPDEHYKQSLRKQEYGVPDPTSLSTLFDAGGIATTTGAAGKITLFDCNAMHGSNSNISPLPRSNVFLVYNSFANRLLAPYSGKAPRPEFIAARRNVRPIESMSGDLANAIA
jgi:ectoine hydroxylase